MQFYIFTLLICLFVFLYGVYLLANDDFIFLRKDVTMEKLFNIILLGVLVCLFFSRLFYGLFYAKNILANIFVFLLFPYFPGLSLLGGVAGAGAVFLFLKGQKSSFPVGRMFDFFSIAFLISLPLGSLGYFMFAEDGFSFQRTLGLIIVYLILFIIFLRLFLPRLLSGKIKEGSIALLFLVSFSAVSLINNVAGWEGKVFIFKLVPENFVLTAMLISSIILFAKQEVLLTKIRQFWKK